MVFCGVACLYTGRGRRYLVGVAVTTGGRQVSAAATTGVPVLTAPSITAGTTAPQQWIRVIPPGVSDPNARISGSIGDLLAGMIDDILRSAQSELAALDLLCYRGRTHQEYLLRACPAADATAGTALPVVAGPSFETIHAGVPDPTTLTARFGFLIATHLIDRLGVEIVQVDPTPLGRTPTLTTRLLLSASASTPLTIGRDQSYSHFATYLDALIEQAVPHVARTVIAPAGPDSYHVEQQVGLFDPTARSLSRRDLAHQLAADDGPSLAAHYDHDEVTSTWAQLASTWRQRDGLPAQSAAASTIVSQTADYDLATTLYALCTQSGEYQRLLGTLGDPAGLAARYQQLEYSPTLTVDADSLPAMLGFLWGYDAPCWDHQHDFDRRPPSLRPLALLRSAPGTDETGGHSPRLSGGVASTEPSWTPTDVSATDWPSASVDPTGEAPDEPTVTERAIKRFREHGDSLSVAGDRFGDIPAVSWCRTPPSGESSAVVIDGDGTVPPGELVAAGSHGAPAYGVTVVTRSQDAAERAARILQTPFVSTDETETALYPRRTSWWARQGLVAVLPRSCSSRWTVDPAGTVRLRAGSDVVARGSIWDGSLAPVRLDSDAANPLRWVDPAASLPTYSSDGTLQTHHADRETLRDQYQSVPLPAVPAYRWWGARATILVLADDGPSVYDPLRELDTWSDAFEAFVSEYLATYTCSADRSIAGTTVGRGVAQFLSAQSVSSPPPPREVAETLAALPERDTGPVAFDTIERDPTTLTLTNRDWIFPAVTADRPSVPFSAMNATGAVASLANSLAVETSS